MLPLAASQYTTPPWDKALLMQKMPSCKETVLFLGIMSRLETAFLQEKMALAWQEFWNICSAHQNTTNLVIQVVDPILIAFRVDIITSGMGIITSGMDTINDWTETIAPGIDTINSVMDQFEIDPRTLRINAINVGRRVIKQYPVFTPILSALSSLPKPAPVLANLLRKKNISLIARWVGFLGRSGLVISILVSTYFKPDKPLTLLLSYLFFKCAQNRLPQPWNHCLSNMFDACKIYSTINDFPPFMEEIRAYVVQAEYFLSSRPVSLILPFISPPLLLLGMFYTSRDRLNKVYLNLPTALKEQMIAWLFNHKHYDNNLQDVSIKTYNDFLKFLPNPKNTPMNLYASIKSCLQIEATDPLPLSNKTIDLCLKYIQKSKIWANHIETSYPDYEGDFELYAGSYPKEAGKLMRWVKCHVIKCVHKFSQQYCSGNDLKAEDLKILNEIDYIFTNKPKEEQYDSLLELFCLLGIGKNVPNHSLISLFGINSHHLQSLPTPPASNHLDRIKENLKTLEESKGLLTDKMINPLLDFLESDEQWREEIDVSYPEGYPKYEAGNAEQARILRKKLQAYITEGKRRFIEQTQYRIEHQDQTLDTKDQVTLSYISFILNSMKDQEHADSLFWEKIFCLTHSYNNESIEWRNVFLSTPGEQPDLSSKLSSHLKSFQEAYAEEIGSLLITKYLIGANFRLQEDPYKEVALSDFTSFPKEYLDSKNTRDRFYNSYYTVNNLIKKVREVTSTHISPMSWEEGVHISREDIDKWIKTSDLGMTKKQQEQIWIGGKLSDRFILFMLIKEGVIGLKKNGTPLKSHGKEQDDKEI